MKLDGHHTTRAGGWKDEERMIDMQQILGYFLIVMVIIGVPVFYCLSGLEQSGTNNDTGWFLLFGSICYALTCAIFAGAIK